MAGRRGLSPGALQGNTQPTCELGFPLRGLVIHQLSISKWHLKAIPNVKYSVGNIVNHIIITMDGVRWGLDFSWTR